jgi:hypothetical protein
MYVMNLLMMLTMVASLLHTSGSEGALVRIENAQPNTV